MNQTEPRLPSLFAAAVELGSPEERARFLERECPDPGLRRELEALLAAHDRPDSLFEGRTALVAGAPAESVGTMIGRYRLLEALGEGGFGSVWLAEQKEPVRRKVALKVIKLGMDTKAVVARFEAERQALALMDHPNIARVLDAGTTESGRPYFVMELVRGVKITDYCDQNQLPTRDRLELFIKVCQAVQHAHQKGIIHRDLKPSNILVTLHDGVPVPKVIDFGIAKATQQELTDMTLHTRFQQFIGTPAYVSPEQAEMSGLDVDTRSDIYSLGVLLYELLTGRTPFDGRQLLASGLDAMRQTIREKEPLRPSTRLASLDGEELTTTAARRSADAARLLHQLQGDLDWIVMKCLEKDRTRRYATANGLAMDLKRHLNSEPVVARPPGRAYRLGKFVRRNKLVVTAGTAVFLALALGFGSTALLALRLHQANQDLLAAQGRAEQAERDRVFGEAMWHAMSGDENAVRSALREDEAQRLTGGHMDILEGLHALATGRPEEAIQALRKATASMTNSVTAHALLATASLFALNYPDYVRYLERLGQLREESDADLLFKGQALSLSDPDRGLPLLDAAVARKRGALAYMLRAEARAQRALMGNLTDIQAALDDLEIANRRSWSERNVSLLTTRCFVHSVAARLYGRAGNETRRDEQLTAAETAGRQLESFAGTPSADMWRIWQLELAGRTNESFDYARRLVEEKKFRSRPLLLSYGNALMCQRNADPRRALEVYDSVPHNGWIDSMRLMAIFELEGREAFDRELDRQRKRYSGDEMRPWWVALLLYAGRRGEAQAEALSVLDTPPGPHHFLRPFDRRLAEYLSGRLTREQFVQAAQGDKRVECYVHFLLGFEAMGEGRSPSAKGHLEAALATDVIGGPSYTCAQVALAQLGRHPDWPAIKPDKPPR